MNPQPYLNVPGSSPKSSQKRASTSGRANDNLPDPYQKARRKRVASRKKRRFDAVFARLPRPARVKLKMQGFALPAVLQPTPWFPSKFLSLFLLLGALTSLVLLNTNEDWFVYREDVRFHNLIRMRGDDLFPLLEDDLGLDGMSIFWVDPEKIRTALLALPWIEDAKVEVGLPVSIVVNVTEMTPAAVWVTNAGNYWLAPDGSALPIATMDDSALPEVALPQIIDTLQEARVIGDGPLAIDPQVLASALTLLGAMPELGESVRYNKSVGLNFALPEPALWVYWGDGFDIDAKLENLAVARDWVRKAEKPAQIVDVRLIDRPYLR